MALFPQCGFKVLVPGGVVRAGHRLDGVLELVVPEDIPRADHLDLVFRSFAWAGYGSGKNRSVYRRDLFLAPLRVDLPKGTPLKRDTYRYPFTVDVPVWLPPALSGPDCAIGHVIETRLDVDWAIDPVAQYTPIVVVPPAEDRRRPVTVRSPNGFHERIVLEVALASSVVAQDEPLSGHVALRSGHDARFDAIVISFTSVVTIRLGRGGRRYGAARAIRIPAESLRSGAAVPFVFPPDLAIPHEFRNGFIDHDVVLRVGVDIPWSVDPSFDVPLHVLPSGSTIHGSADVVAVGSERLRQIAAAMAQATGLRLGRAPVLVEGAAGPVSLRIVDSPSEGRLGIDIDIGFPDVELGIVFRPLGMLEGFRDSPLLPPALRDRYFLRVHSEEKNRPPVSDDVLASFVHTLLEGLSSSQEVRLSDHHLGIHFSLANDGSEQMIALAREVHARAKAVEKAISSLPFPEAFASAGPAWRATAAEQNAVLVPSGPALHGLVFGARVLGGEERRIGAAIMTSFADEGVITRVDVDLGGMPLPKEAIAELEADEKRAGTHAPARLAPIRAVFPMVEVIAHERVVLERPGFTADPRALLSAIEQFFWWALETRGERRADQPYR